MISETTQSLLSSETPLLNNLEMPFPSTAPTETQDDLFDIIDDITRSIRSLRVTQERLDDVITQLKNLRKVVARLVAKLWSS